MRLIDADRFKGKFNTDTGIGIRMRLMIDKQPSAYDVDKVVEEIEDTITSTTEYRHKFCGTVEVGRCASYESCECCIAERMIEIIKSGGVADD